MNTIRIKILELMPDYILGQVIEVKSTVDGIPLDYQIRRSLKAGACEIVVPQKPVKQDNPRSRKKTTKKFIMDEE